ncbi:hypothetical protein D3C76_1471650 [compost metagenome]
MRDFLHPRIDRRCPVMGPVRAPAPTQPMGTVRGQDSDVAAGGNIVVRQRLIADFIGQGTGHAQGVDEIVNATVLAESSAHAMWPLLVI